MRSRTLVSFAALGAFTVLAFGSMGGDSSFDLDELGDLGDVGGAGGVAGGGNSVEANMQACKDHVAHWNTMDCLKSVPRDDSFCDGFNNAYVDYRPYFQCLTENTKCNGAIPDLGGASSCKVDL